MRFIVNQKPVRSFAFAEKSELIIKSAVFCGAFFCFPGLAWPDAVLDNAETVGETIDERHDDVLELETVVTEDVAIHEDEALTAELARVYAVKPVERSAAKSLGDVFRGESALRVSESGGRLQQQSVSMRGSASQDVLVKYHGITLNALSNASADLSLIPAGLLKRIAVKPNVGSERDGSGALGGVIELDSGFSEHAFEGSLSVGTLSDYAILGRKPILGDVVSTELAVFADRTSGRFEYIDAQGEHQVREHNGAWRFGGQFDMLVALDGASIEAFAFYAYLFREVGGLSEFADSFKEATSHDQTALASVTASFDPVAIGESEAEVHVTAVHRFAEDAYQNPSTVLGARKMVSNYFENRTQLGADAGFDYAEHLKTYVGVAYEYQRVLTDQLVLNQMVEAVHDRHITSFIAEESGHWFEDRFKAFAGVRAEYVSGQGWAFSPRVALAYLPWTWLTLDISSAYANRYPAFDEMYMLTESIKGDSNLKKQTSILNNLSLSFIIENWFKLDIDAFYNIHYDLIRFIPVSLYGYAARNLSESTARGFDLRGTLFVYDYFELDVGYSYNDSFVNDGHLPIPGIPRHRVTGRATGKYGIFDAWFQVSYSNGIATKMSGQYIRKNPLKLDAHIGFDLFKSVVISLDVNNILNDKETEDFRQYPLPGATGMLSVEIVLDE